MPLANLQAKIEKDALREGKELLAEARSRAEAIIFFKVIKPAMG